jgi:hypothetical protein
MVVVPEAATRPSSFEVRRDGLLLPPGAWATPIAVDPGAHTIEAQAAGKKRWSITVEWGSIPETKTVTIPILDDEPFAPESDRRGRALTPMRAGALMVGGLGVVGAVVGGFFGVRAIERNSASCSATACTPQAHQQKLDARADGNLSTAAWVAAAALIGGGVTLWIFGKADASDRPAAELSASGIGVELRGHF